MFDLTFWILAILGVTLTGISKSGFAGGAGVVAVPLMSLYIPFEHTVVIMLPLLIVMDYKMMPLPIQDSSINQMALYGQAESMVLTILHQRELKPQI